MKTMRITAIALVAAAAILALAAAACGSGGGDSSSVQIIAPADFAVADYAGKPLVVNFFGSWCGPCNSEAPDLAAFAKDNPEAAFVGIALNDSEDAAAGFMGKYDLEYPLIVDDNSLAAKYGISGVPTTIFFDAQGQERDRLVGAATADQLAASLAKAQ